MVIKIDEPQAEVKQLTEKDGLGKSYAAENDGSTIDNIIYIAGAHINRASDLYDDKVLYSGMRSQLSTNINLSCLVCKPYHI